MGPLRYPLFPLALLLVTGCAATQDRISKRGLARACLAGDLDACSSRAVQRLSEKDGAEQEAARSTLDELCRAGHSASCLAFWKDEGTCDRNPQQCLSERKRHCELGNAEMCVLAGQTLLRPGYLYLEEPSPELEQERRRLLERGCQRGAMQGCVALAELEESPSDPGALAALAEGLRRACDEGLPRACALYAPLLRDGRGVRADAERARQVAQAACLAGETGACGVGVEDECLRGKWASCEKLAMAPEQELSEEERSNRRRILGRACAEGKAAACFHLTTYREVADEAVAGACHQPSRTCVLVAGNLIDTSAAEFAEAQLQIACDAGLPFSGEACFALVASDRPGVGLLALEKGCALQHPASCLLLASHLEMGNGMVRNRTRAAALRIDACAVQARVCAAGASQAEAPVAACLEGDPAACARIEEILLCSSPISCEAQDAEKLAACDGGSMQACHEVASRFARVSEDVDISPEDRARALELYGRACERGSAESCAEKAGLLASSRGGAKQFEEALATSERACRLGSTRGCQQAGSFAPLLASCKPSGKSCIPLADFYLEGPPHEEDSRRALSLLETACQRRSAEACARLGELHESGSLPDGDPEKALGYYQKAQRLGSKDAGGYFVGNYSEARLSCDRGERAGCEALLSYYERVLPDDMGARSRHPAAETFAALTRRACELGSSLQCAMLGKLLIAGLGVPKDDAAGMAQLERSCTMGERHGCAAVFDRWIRPRASAEDVSRGLHALDAACKAELGEACYEVGRIFDMGAPGIERDPRRAADHYRRACENGDPRGCD
ncbi:MAG: hypothetical protein WBV82_00715 [Myxococcaceae bacterium]